MAATQNHFRAQMRIQYALKDRDTRVASLIVESLRNTLDLIDHQPPAVLTAIYDYLGDMLKTDTRRRGPLCRKDVRTSVREYVDCSLVEARKRERRLYHGITGEPNHTEK